MLRSKFTEPDETERITQNKKEIIIEEEEEKSES
jgi:hypothetical protein